MRCQPDIKYIHPSYQEAGAAVVAEIRTPIKNKTVRGERRRYYSYPFIPYWAAIYTYLGFHENVDVPPPTFRHRHAYPKSRPESGTGVAVVDSPWLKVWPAFGIDALVILIIIAAAIIAQEVAILLLLIPALVILAIFTWLAYARWLTTAMVIKGSSVTFFRGIYATRTKTVQGADIGSIEVRNPGDSFLATVLTKNLDISIVRVEFNAGSPSTDLGKDGKERRSLNRFVLRGIGNGAAVENLLNQLQRAWEESITQSAEAEVASLDVLVGISERMDRIMDTLNSMGQVFVQSSNREAELTRRSHEQNDEIIDLLRTIAKGGMSGERTEPIPLITPAPEIIDEDSGKED